MNKNALLEILREIKEEVTDKTPHAICGLVEHKARDRQIDGWRLVDIMQDIWKEWDKFSGLPAFPVTIGGRGLENCVGSFMSATLSQNFWDATTKYGSTRRELLDFMITSLEGELE